MANGGTISDLVGNGRGKLTVLTTVVLLLSSGVSWWITNEGRQYTDDRIERAAEDLSRDVRRIERALLRLEDAMARREETHRRLDVLERKVDTLQGWVYRREYRPPSEPRP